MNLGTLENENMAHNIHQERCAFAKGKAAWHQLGTVVEDKAMTVADALKLGGLDYEVSKVPAFFKTETPVVSDEGCDVVEGYESGDGCFLTIADWEDGKRTALGMVGNRYTILQNREAFTFIDPLIEAGEACIDSCGVLDGGRKTWINVHLPDLGFDVGPKSAKDRIEAHLLCFNAHDGSGSCIIANSGIRTVCQNTAEWAIGEAINKLRIRHTASIADRVAEATRTMGIAQQQSAKAQQAYNAMADRKLAKDELTHLILGVLEIEAKADGKLANRDAKTVQTVGELMAADVFSESGTLWAAFNGLTAYADHAMPKRGKLNGAVKSIWQGGSAKLKQRATSAALELVGLGSD